MNAESQAVQFPTVTQDTRTKRKACFRQGKQARRYVHEKGIEAELERVNNTEYYEEDEYEYEW